MGLNLQNAQAVVNLDQPWNPAVLEQRIGRVHRFGQHRPVRVVHFIAQGTIEEGMLNLLAFKKSMFAGVLDGGQSEVFLGGTRLKQFMESVEKASGSIPPSMPQQTEARRGRPAPRSPSRSPHRFCGRCFPGRTAAAELDRSVVGRHVAFGKTRTDVADEPAKRPEQSSAGGPPAAMLARDEATGQQYLKLPLPDGEVVQKIADLLSVFTGKQIRG